MSRQRTLACDEILAEAMFAMMEDICISVFWDGITGVG